MLLFFTGSDWCGWCHRLQREVFNTPAFTTWASSDVILVELDFPRNKVLPQNIKEQNHVFRSFEFSNIFNLETEIRKRDDSIPSVRLGSVGQV